MIHPDTYAALVSAVRLCEHVLREFPEEFQPESWARVRATLLETTTAALRRADDDAQGPEGEQWVVPEMRASYPSRTRT